MILETVMHSIHKIFHPHQTTGDLEKKFAAVNAKTDRIKAQIDRMDAVFDEWARECGDRIQ